MNPVHRIRRLLACLSGPPGAGARPASKPPGPAGRRAGRSGPDGAAARFIQDMAAAASMAAGHQLVWPSHRPTAAVTGTHDPADRPPVGHHIQAAIDRGGN